MGSRSIKAAKVRVGELLLVICSLVNNDLAGAFAAPTGGAPRQVCPGSEFRTLWARRITDGRPCRRDHSRMASGFVHRCVPSTKHPVHEPKSRSYEIVGDVVRSHGCGKGRPDPSRGARNATTDADVPARAGRRLWRSTVGHAVERPYCVGDASLARRVIRLGRPVRDLQTTARVKRPQRGAIP
jgi:hypothetical protein